MIPIIEQIIYDLLCGKLDESQSIGLIEQHIELARQAVEDDGLRDHFASLAMQMHGAALSDIDIGSPAEWDRHVAERAYTTADAMLKARNS